VTEAEWDILSNAVLDGLASDLDGSRVSAEIVRDEARARDFARRVMLHEALERSLSASSDGRTAARRVRFVMFSRRLALAAAMLALAAGAAWFAIGTNQPASAAAMLERLAEVARSGDRTYYLRAIGAPKGPDVPEKRSGRPQPAIDGAILSLRAPDSYVLARLDANGEEVLTGSDGLVAWIVPSKGPVRVSRDTTRFSGALPGSRHAIAFIDPHGDLTNLAANYDLAPAPARDRLARIVGTRRADARGGPKRIEIAYDPATAVIHAMRLENLPQARGGPRSVEFELIDEAPLDAAYFTHGFHHGAARVVIEE
jgi:hypothetical protein